MLEENPDLIPGKVKAAQKKQAEKKSEKTTAAIDDEIILYFQHFDLNDAFTSVPINENIVFLEDVF